MLIQKALYSIKKHQLLQKGESVLIGVSGGPDSLALLHFMDSIKDRFSLRLGVAHVDHMFRGEESYLDYLFVKEWCERLAIPFYGIRIDVPAYMEQTGKSSQVAARECRYAHFEDIMKKHNIHKLVLGHHGDDQMETMLMRFTRGAAGSARAGIASKRSFPSYEVVRPFLWASRAEIDEYCRIHHLNPRLDESNDKLAYTRNRFRHRVLPFLKEENPKAHEHFQLFSEELLEDEAFLLSLAEEKLDKMWVKGTNESKIDIPSFLQMSKPLQRRAIQLILNYLYFERHEELSAAHIESVINLFHHSHPSGEIHLPSNLKVRKSYDSCTFAFGEQVSEPYSFTLHIPGELILPNGCMIKAHQFEGGTAQGNDTFTLDPERTQLPLTVRTRKNGDRMKMKGLNGTRKVKDIFIDHKIPLADRALWPIVVDDNQEILWIPGLKKSNQEAAGVNKSFITLKYV
ncbi:tRNA lysidine(34) synthetase TilS [Bacillus testis]|uniref:tRNA lysidine(34) synthetase TilS n=1 Tax=Bacillus testis TaxID=1622072 RepID=UPI00067EDDCC|nr:tRNA lysidine(34) synthetase TilS [Bacillus testis]